ncbi:MAG TPA: CHASE3 domain-containing protein [Tepidisphaeraceae bacterium]|jgi:PAS domain S-box-containing protein|nr:CHASE3 domain-containing protein [Tepidisphaeraceae bacterium]
MRVVHSAGTKGPRGIFIIVALVLIASIIAAYLFGAALVSSQKTLIREQAVIDHLQRTLSIVKDLETGQRGFVLTGQPSYLQPYDSATRIIQQYLDELNDLTVGDGLPPADVARFKQLTQSKITELHETIRLRRDKGFDAALAQMQTGTGKQLMDDLRSLTTQMVDAETVKLNATEEKTVQLNTDRTAIFVLTVVINLIFLYWAFTRIRHEMIDRERQRQLLQVTLASIGDGVIVTDTDAKITFINTIAEHLTGWSAAEAVGRSCIEVFDIVNETTRELVENPIAKVLRLGTIVGLANHTVLIRKDRSELPIDDSGAPIRDLDGTIRGAVLVFRDFTDHKQAAAELQKATEMAEAAREEAEAANVAKDNFLATLSHELRTPLTPVSVTLSTWESNPDLPESFRPDVQMLRRNVDLEARLIDDLLDLTRIVRGKLVLNPEVADLHELVNSITEMDRSEVNAKQLKLTVKLDAPRHHVYADPARLQQVFWNIFRNATKFTPIGGSIDVHTANDAQGNVTLTVRDSGIGMTRDFMDRLFKPFEQGDAEMVRRYGGLGLGLAISKALIESLGGSISAQSDGPGQGSLFTVTLKSVDIPSRTTTPPTRSRPLPSHPLRILLVEDHEDTVQVLARLLRALNHQVFTAGTVTDALKHFKNEDSFDLLISDIGLPDGTGMDLMRQVRQSSKIPAVALTGFGMEDDIAACKQAGFNDHLTKPLNFVKLQTLIEQIGNSRNN